MSRRRLVVATRNRGKLAELQALLESVDVDVVPLDAVVPNDFSVVEDGETFEANAQKKALAVALHTQTLTLADDSGLEVDALGGAPGVYSARFAGAGATDAENNAALVAALKKTGFREPFTARFRCVLALVDPASEAPPTDASCMFFEGVCEGAITLTPEGQAGFGYDPHFVVAANDALGRIRTATMAMLSADEKNRISHRARAFAKLREGFARDR